jgi:hypothetical protein
MVDKMQLKIKNFMLKFNSSDWVPLGMVIHFFRCVAQVSLECVIVNLPF